MFKPFFSIFTKEFMSYFKTGSGYVILAIYIVLSMAATFYFGGFFVLNNSGLSSFFNFQPEILALLIPAVTMRTWADERRSGTIEYLLTQPVNYVSIVLAKYFSACVFGVIMLSLTLPFWIYSDTLITLDNLNILSGYLVCVLIVCTFAALGCVVSAFNTNPVIAYIVSIFVSWGVTNINLNFLIAPAGKMANEVFVKIIQSLNFSKHYLDFISGQIGMENIIYFLSIIILALWLNVVTIEYKKS